ncbi:MAG: NifU family protein [Bacteroidetes bacterium]|nr:MAG: NifU family protein [Bacteroidota bacterium]GIV57381.1 MAG: NifU family protein [Rhodothermaceae bacterium]
MSDEKKTPTTTDETYHPGQDPELRQRVEEALDLLRPYLMADGGSVRLLDITEDYVVELELLGACGTCPMSTMTLRAGIEQALKRTIPQITRVEAVNAPAAY